MPCVNAARPLIGEQSIIFSEDDDAIRGMGFSYLTGADRHRQPARLWDFYYPIF